MNTIISEKSDIASPDLSGDAPLDLRDVDAVDAARIIKEARKQAHLTQAELAERLGITQSVVSDWERGKLESWRDYAERLATVLNKPKGHFATLDPVPVSALGVLVIGEVQAGVFKAALQYPENDRHALPIAAVRGFETHQLFALKIVGPSMDLLYPDGSYVIVVRAMDTDVRDGDRVVVHTHRAGLWEATLKEARQDEDGRLGLWPRSTHPDYQQPVYLDNEDQDGPRITYVVVARYAEEDRPPPPPPIVFPRKPNR